VIEGYGCLNYNTGVDTKVELYLAAITSLCDIHFWVFAVKYLTKGIEYTRLKADDTIDKSIKIGLFGLGALYAVYGSVPFAISAATMPIFKPLNVTSNFDCDKKFDNYIGELVKW
jgi:hypothetical protein